MSFTHEAFDLPLDIGVVLLRFLFSSFSFAVSAVLKGPKYAVNRPNEGGKATTFIASFVQK